MRMVGAGYETAFFVPTRDRSGLIFNERFRRQYYPTQLSARGHPFRIDSAKPADTIRIFVLGESAALGTPNPSFGFARILGVMLRERYPQQKFEIINAAMRGINSHIIRHIAMDCARHSPDIALIYAGNNEVVGFAAPGPASPRIAQNLTLIRARQTLKRSKLAQLIESGIARARRSPETPQDMEYFRRQRLAYDDPRRARVYANFRANLTDICRALTGAGARVLLSTVPVNMFDCPPLASLHSASLASSAAGEWERLYQQGAGAEAREQWESALAFYRDAARIDDHFAELHFRTGLCLFALGRAEEARMSFNAARDRDALQFRADGPVNTAIRETAMKFRKQGVDLIDSELAMANSPLSARGMPGNRLFLDHVHPRFDGDYILASSFYDAIVSLAFQVSHKPSAKPPPPPSRDECARALAFTGWDELEVDVAVAEMLARPPFVDQLDHDARIRRLRAELKTREEQYRQQGLRKELDIYRQAIARAPQDWELRHNFGMILTTLGQYAAAVEQLQVEADAFPDSAWCRLEHARALANAGRFVDAEREVQKALQIESQLQPAHNLLHEIKLRSAN